MSTLKATNLQHASAASPNIVLDSSGNATMAGSMAMATPFAMKNKIINGAMEIDQRNAGSAVTINAAANTYTIDRWLAAGQAADGVFTVQRSTVVPTGFTNSVAITVTTADASIGATQAYYFRQNIEGYNVSGLGFGSASAATVTLSFWVRSSVTGTFGGALNNSAFNRSYPFSYAISAVNTWEYKTVTLTGDTSGTWLTDSGIGLAVTWSLGMGSTYSGTANAWAGALYLAPTSATNLISTNGATFYLTGVQLEVGSIATPFERRLYNQELAMCQRYYQVIGSGSLGRYGSSTSCELFWMTSIPLRTSPTIAAVTSAANLFRVGIASGTTSTFSAASNGGTNKGGAWIITFSGGVSPSAGELAGLVTDAVSLSAEL